MTTALDSVWSRAPSLIASLTKAAAEPPVVPPAVPATPALPKPAIPKPEDTMLDNLRDIREGKTLLGNYQPSGPFADLVANKKFDTVGNSLSKYLPSDVEKPAELGQAQRTLLALRTNPELFNSIKEQRMFTNPYSANTKLTADELNSVYNDRAAAFKDEDRKAYEGTLYKNPLEKIPYVGDKERTAVQGQVQSEVEKQAAEGHKQLLTSAKAVEADPKGSGFTDWLTSNWGNIAVPVGALLTMFGGDTGKLLGGIAMLAGGANIYDRYQTLTKDPVAQTAFKQYAASGFNPATLAHIEKTLGPTYSQAARDGYAGARWGFASYVHGAYDRAGNNARAAYGLPAQKAAPVAAANSNWTNDWAAKSMDKLKGWKDNIFGSSTP